MTQPLLAELVPGRLYVILGYPSGSCRYNPPWYLHEKNRVVLLLSVEEIVGEYAGHVYSVQACGYLVRFLDNDGQVVQDQFQHGSWLHDRIYSTSEQH